MDERSVEAKTPHRYERRIRLRRRALSPAISI
jgi:hypothetical protein